MSDRIEVHRLVREHNGPGRVEFVFDREMSRRADVVEQIGTFITSHEKLRDAEGAIVERESRKYRVIWDAHVPERNREGKKIWGIFLEPMKPLAPLPPPILNHGVRWNPAWSLIYGNGV